MAVEFPVPSSGGGVVAAPAPGSGPGFWSGAPSAALDTDGTLVVAYRVRVPDQRGSKVVIARTADGQHLTTVVTVTKERVGAESLERPALLRIDDRWRLYISCATPGSKHWRIDVLEAADLASFHTAERRTVFAGSSEMGVKDPVVRRSSGRWQAWICCHPLDQPGEEDRMTTAYATSDDGLDWQWHGMALSGRAGTWDARGARVTATLPDGRASYDGRATKEENFSERTGIARPSGQGNLLVAISEMPVSKARYLDVVPLPGGGYQLFFEMPRADGSHDLCSQRIR